MDPINAAWITAVSSFIAAALSALLTHLYCNRRDRAVLSVGVETFAKFRLPVAIPKDVYAKICHEGVFSSWAEDIVKWDIKNKIERNEFELMELQDLRSLCSKFLSRYREKTDDLRSMLDSFKSCTSVNSLTNDQKDTLARLRHFWLRTFKQDIFMALAKNFDETINEIRQNFKGDLEQWQRVLEAVEALGAWLNQGLGKEGNQGKRITPTPRSPDNTQDPYLCVELLARNSGRSETLIRETATLRIGDFSLPLRGITEKQGFELYSGKYWRIKPTSIEQLRFAQDPRETTLAQLQKVRDLIDDRRHKAVITIQDYIGNQISTDEFDLRDKPDGQ